MVVELFAHTGGVVKNGPFLPNYSGPIRVKGFTLYVKAPFEPPNFHSSQLFPDAKLQVATQTFSES